MLSVRLARTFHSSCPYALNQYCCSRCDTAGNDEVNEIGFVRFAMAVFEPSKNWSEAKVHVPTFGAVSSGEMYRSLAPPNFQSCAPLLSVKSSLSSKRFVHWMLPLV